MKNEKVWPAPHNWPTCDQGSCFDDVLPTREEVGRWVAHVLGVRTSIVQSGPVLTLRSWSAAAIYKAGRQKVVFKLIRLPVCTGCGSVYRQLNESSPDRTPRILGCRASGTSTWLLLEYAEGTPASEIPSQDNAIGIARQMARIQAEYAEMFRSDTTGILDISVSRVVPILQILIDRIESVYEPQWNSGGAIRRRNGEDLIVELPTDFLQQLKGSVHRVEAVVQEILSYGWPSTIVHTDLHPANGIVGPDRRIRIIDWDQAAFGFACESAYWLDSIADAAEWKDNREETVRSAYLDELPWGARDERERVWDLGEKISRIYTAYQADRGNASLARANPRSGNIAALLLASLSALDS